MNNLDRAHSRAVASFPVATSSFQSRFHLRTLALSFLSPRVFSIQERRAFSSSGTKNEERRDSTVSKLAVLDVIWSMCIISFYNHKTRGGKVNEHSPR